MRLCASRAPHVRRARGVRAALNDVSFNWNDQGASVSQLAGGGVDYGTRLDLQTRGVASSGRFSKGDLMSDVDRIVVHRRSGAESVECTGGEGTLIMVEFSRTKLLGGSRQKHCRYGFLPTVLALVVTMNCASSAYGVRGVDPEDPDSLLLGAAAEHDRAIQSMGDPNNVRPEQIRAVAQTARPQLERSIQLARASAQLEVDQGAAGGVIEGLALVVAASSGQALSLFAMVDGKSEEAVSRCEAAVSEGNLARAILMRAKESHAKSLAELKRVLGRCHLVLAREYWTRNRLGDARTHADLAKECVETDAQRAAIDRFVPVGNAP